MFFVCVWKTIKSSQYYIHFVPVPDILNVDKYYKAIIEDCCDRVFNLFESSVTKYLMFLENEFATNQPIIIIAYSIFK